MNPPRTALSNRGTVSSEDTGNLGCRKPSLAVAANSGATLNSQAGGRNALANSKEKCIRRGWQPAGTSPGTPFVPSSIDSAGRGWRAGLVEDRGANLPLPQFFRCNQGKEEAARNSGQPGGGNAAGLERIASLPANALSIKIIARKVRFGRAKAWERSSQEFHK
jgi:hypothetical protein